MSGTGGLVREGVATIRAALSALPGADAVRALAGRADVKALQLVLDCPPDPPAPGNAAADWNDEARDTTETVALSPVPVLAVLRGHCHGPACLVALACHFRIAAPGARLGPWPCVGADAPPAAQGLPDGLLPPGAATLLASGRAIATAEALAAGLLDRLVPEADLEPAAHALLRALVARRSPAQVRAVMEAVGNARRLPLRDALRRETELFLALAAGSPAGGAP